jgi:hypothetical protein
VQPCSCCLQGYDDELNALLSHPSWAAFRDSISRHEWPEEGQRKVLAEHSAWVAGKEAAVAAAARRRAERQEARAAAAAAAEAAATAASEEGQEVEPST